MTDFALALGLVAPYYNFVFVVITLYLFIKLFKTEIKPRVLFPWKILFAALIIFILEELLTVLRAQHVVNIPIHINGFFELGIITLFIYTLLKQKEVARV